MLKQKVNLATLCLCMFEEIEKHYAGSGYLLKPMPMKEAFEIEITIEEDVYRALYGAVCGLIDEFCKGNDEIVVSTYQMGIVITGLAIASKDLYDLCLVENDKYLIQRSRLGIVLAFLQQEQVKIEQNQVYGGRDGICFVLPKGD